MSTASQRPGGLTAICIIAIALGAIGSCCALTNLGSLAMQDRLSRVNQRIEAANGSEAVRHEQELMRHETEAYAATMLPYTASLSFVALLLGLVLLVAGVLALNLKAGGRILLMVLAVLVPLFEIPRTAIEGVVSWHLSEIMQTHMHRVMELTALEHGGAAPPAGFMSGVMNASSAVTFVVIGLWVLAKIVYLGVAFFYLRKPEIRAYYG